MAPGSPSGARPEVCVSDSSVKRHEWPRHFPTDGDAAHISDSGATGKPSAPRSGSSSRG
jgi:hypothetical protein